MSRATLGWIVLGWVGFALLPWYGFDSATAPAFADYLVSGSGLVLGLKGALVASADLAAAAAHVAASRWREPTLAAPTGSFARALLGSLSSSCKASPSASTAGRSAS